MNYDLNGTRFTQTGQRVRRSDGYTYIKWQWTTAAGVHPSRNATAAESRVLNSRRAASPCAMSLPGVHPS